MIMSFIKIRTHWGLGNPWNPGMVWLGKNLKAHLVPPPRAGTPPTRPGCSGPIPYIFCFNIHGLWMLAIKHGGAGAFALTSLVLLTRLHGANSAQCPWKLLRRSPEHENVTCKVSQVPVSTQLSELEPLAQQPKKES